jgi:hypothetical protein
VCRCDKSSVLEIGDSFNVVHAAKRLVLVGRAAALLAAAAAYLQAKCDTLSYQVTELSVFQTWRTNHLLDP